MEESDNKMTFERFLVVFLEDDDPRWGKRLLNYIEESDVKNLRLVSQTTKIWIELHSSPVLEITNMKLFYHWHLFVQFWSQPSSQDESYQDYYPEILACSSASDSSEHSVTISDKTSALPNLLSLTGLEEAKSRLLHFISDDGDGLEDLLNLRLVCKTTKAWIDSLPSKLGQSLFANSFVYVDLINGGVLERFLTASPPRHVTSMQLVNLQNESLLKINRFTPPPGLMKRRNSAEEPQRRRVDARLQYLEIEFFILPLHSKISQLMTSTNLKKFRAKHLVCKEDKEGLLPHFFFELEELHLDYVDFESQIEKDLYERLSASTKLRVLTLCVTAETNFPAFADLINDSRRKYTTFYFNMDPNILFSETELVNKFSLFLISILENRPNIRVKNMKAQDLQKMKSDFLSEEMFFKLSRCIHSLVVYGISSTEFDYGMLGNFSSLEHLYLSGNLNSMDKHLPGSLITLEVRSGLPSVSILPQGLTTLIIGQDVCSYNEVVGYLKELDKHCPRLQTLELNLQDLRLPLYYSGEPNFPINAVALFEENRQYQKLRTLSLTLYRWGIEQDETENGIRQILFDGLKLPTLPLRRLQISKLTKIKGDDNICPVFNTENVKELLNGRISKTLRTVEIMYNLISKDAWPFIEKLTEYQSFKKRGSTYPRWNNVSSPF